MEAPSFVPAAWKESQQETKNVLYVRIKENRKIYCKLEFCAIVEGSSKKWEQSELAENKHENVASMPDQQLYFLGVVVVVACNNNNTPHTYILVYFLCTCLSRSESASSGFCILRPLSQ